MVRYQQRALYFRLWNMLKRKIEAEREEERAEIERRQEEVRELTADGHRRRHLTRAAVKAFRKHARASQMERELEREHETRKLAIDDFFGNLREKAREEEERLKREKLDRIQRD